MGHHVGLDTPKRTAVWLASEQLFEFGTAGNRR